MHRESACSPSPDLPPPSTRLIGIGGNLLLGFAEDAHLGWRLVGAVQEVRGLMYAAAAQGIRRFWRRAEEGTVIGGVHPSSEG